MTMQRVIFRKFRKDGDVIAFFPDQKDGAYVGSYQHIGQHGNAMYPHPDTIPAKLEEYADLLAELRGIGYELRIMRRRSAP